MSYKRWDFMQLNKTAASDLAESSGLDPFLCLLMTGLGITDTDVAMDFLVSNDLQSDAFAFADMDIAAERVQRAIDNGEFIAVYGDYDADGVTATVLLYSYLRYRGAHVCYRLPRRDGEGYGLHCNSIDELAQMGVQLIVTVDNGVSAVDEIAYAAQCGIDVVVTDHHQPPEVLPAAVAVVDPHRRDCPSEFKDFAGVGMAFWLVCALEGDPDWALEEYADLVAVGTLADVMPLHADNRVLVRRGLQKLNAGTNLGLRKLRELAGAAERALTATAVSFTLAPRINAAGRMGDPLQAVDLLLCDEDDRATTLASAICELNTERQKTEAQILQALQAQIEAKPHRLADRVLVFWGEGWHHGVLGILAARMQERFGKPCVILSIENGIAHGSGRSLPGFSLFEALTACDDCLLGYGGHELAAGLTVEAARLLEFCERINAYAANQDSLPVPELRLQCRLNPSQITPALADSLSALEPFGAGNPTPLFALCNMTLERIEAVGGGKHLRLTLARDGVKISAMKFSATPQELPFALGELVNVAVTLETNHFRGVAGVTILVKDIRYADSNQEDFIAAWQLYDSIIRRDTPNAITKFPKRDDIVFVYRLLQQRAFRGPADVFCHTANQGGVSAESCLISLQLLREANLIEWQNEGNTVFAVVRKAQGKTDLQQTETGKFILGLEN